MGIYPSDRHGEYQRLHSFLNVRQCHGGGYYCCQQEARRYFDGVIRVVDGPAVFSRDESAEVVALMQIHTATQIALECVTKAPK